MTYNPATVQDTLLTMDGQSYRLRLIGGTAVGGTSLIYLAQQWDHQTNAAAGSPLILKRFRESDREIFEVERDVLKDAASHDGQGDEQHFPRLIAASEQHVGGEHSYLLLMEHAGESTLDTRIPLEESEALLTIMHYIDCMITLAQAGYTCWDRKLKDFFWTPPGALKDPKGKLIVVDWNMAEKWSPGRMGHDITEAGRLLYEALTGIQALKRAGSASYYLEREIVSVEGVASSGRPLKTWKQVSFGTQQIVEQLLTGAWDLVSGAQEGDSAKTAMLDRLASIKKRCQEVIGLWKTDIAPLMNGAGELLQKGDWKDALARSSIATLKESPQTEEWWETSSQYPAYRNTHEAAKKQLIAQGDKLAQPRQQIKAGQVQEARASLATLQVGSANLSLEQELASLRWLILIDTYQGRPGDSAQASVIAEVVQASESALEGGSFEEAHNLGATRLGQGSVLATEMYIRDRVQQAEFHFNRGAYSKAKEMYQEARRVLTSVGEGSTNSEKRFWKLLQEAVGPLDQKINEAGKYGDSKEVPDQSLSLAKQHINTRHFEEAVQELRRGVDNNSTRRDLYVAWIAAKQLASLQRLAGGQDADKVFDRSTITELILLAGTLKKELPPDYQDYPVEILNKVRSIIDSTWRRLKSDQFPSRLVEARELLQRARTLLVAIPALQSIEGGEQQAQQTPLQKLPGNGSYPEWATGPRDDTIDVTALPRSEQLKSSVDALEVHVNSLEYIDQLVSNLKLTIPPEHQLVILETAQKLGLRVTSNDTDVEAEIYRVKEMLKNDAEKRDKKAFDSLLNEIRTWLPTKISSEEVSQFIQELQDKLAERLSQYPLQEAKSLRNWVEHAASTLPEVFRQLEQNRSASSNIASSLDILIQPKLTEFSNRLQMAQGELQTLRSKWPQELEAAPELSRITDRFSIDRADIWRNRYAVMDNRWKALRDGGSPLPRKLIELESVLLSMQECQIQTGTMVQSAELERHKYELREEWNAYYLKQQLPTDGELRKQLGESLERVAQRAYRDNELMPALWLDTMRLSLIPRGEHGLNTQGWQGLGLTATVRGIEAQAERKLQSMMKETQAELLKSDDFQRDLKNLINEEIQAALARGPFGDGPGYAPDTSIMKPNWGDLLKYPGTLDIDQMTRLWVWLVLLPPEARIPNIAALQDKVREFGKETASGYYNAISEVLYRMVYSLLNSRMQIQNILGGQ